MGKIIDEILNYTKYLKRQGLLVSFHFTKPYRSAINTTKLVAFNSHNSPYCIKVKQDKQGLKRCLLCQALVIKKCNLVPSFTGSCHAGIKEYIHGIFLNGKCIGFISVSGYRPENAVAHKNSQYSYLYNASTVSAVPDIKMLDAVISPLRIMFEIYLQEYKPENIPLKKEYLKILDYVNNHYQNITLDMLCKRFAYSKSHISHLFKTNNGKSIRQYANTLKIRDAKVLLKTTDLNMTEIALMIGFNDISYFIHTFRDITGTTPVRYRKEL